MTISKKNPLFQNLNFSTFPPHFSSEINGTSSISVTTPGSNQPQPQPQPVANGDGGSEVFGCKVFVGRLEKCSRDMLCSVFGKIGEISEVNFWQHRRYAFVSFSSPTTAQEAVASLNGSMIFGRPIYVGWPKNRANHSFSSRHSNNKRRYVNLSMNGSVSAASNRSVVVVDTVPLEFDKLRSFLVKRKASVAHVSRFGPYGCIIVCSDDDSVARSLDHSFGTEFEVVAPMADKGNRFFRFVWLEIRGVPIKFFSEKNATEIASCFGKVISVAKASVTLGNVGSMYVFVESTMVKHIHDLVDVVLETEGISENTQVWVNELNDLPGIKQKCEEGFPMEWVSSVNREVLLGDVVVEVEERVPSEVNIGAFSDVYTNQMKSYQEALLDLEPDQCRRLYDLVGEGDAIAAADKEIGGSRAGVGGTQADAISSGVALGPGENGPISVDNLGLGDNGSGKVGMKSPCLCPEGDDTCRNLLAKSLKACASLPSSSVQVNPIEDVRNKLKKKPGKKGRNGVESFALEDLEEDLEVGNNIQALFASMMEGGEDGSLVPTLNLNGPSNVISYTFPNRTGKVVRKEKINGKLSRPGSKDR